MTEPGASPKVAQRGAKRPSRAVARGGADWAAGLKQLYDAVVDEPIPDAFKDLLSKLDDTSR